MRLWLVRRTDMVDYEEFDAFVVRAWDEDDAARVVWETYAEGLGMAYTLGIPGTFDVFRSRMDVTPIGRRGPREIVLDSFNAG